MSADGSAAAASPAPLPCAQCGARATARCARCRRASAAYCSQACQRAAWPLHKAVCAPPPQPPLPRGGGGGGGAFVEASHETEPDRARQEFIRRQVASAAELETRDRMGGLVRAQQAMNAARAQTLAAALQGRFTVRRAAPGGGALVARASELEDGEQIVVEWWPPPAEEGAAAVAAGGGAAPDAAAAEAAERSTPRRVELLFLAPGSLAAELYTASSGVVEDFRIVRGGLLYLVGAPELFWSLALHWRETDGQTGLPPQRRAAQWESAWGLRELEAHLRRLTAAAPAARGGPMQLSSQSLAATQLVRGVALLRSQKQGANARGGAADARFLADLHPMTSGEPIPKSEAEVPAWWRALRELWDGALRRSESGAPCMFANTSAGCAAGEAACCARHDEAYGTAVRALLAARFGINATPR